MRCHFVLQIFIWLTMNSTKLWNTYQCIKWFKPFSLRNCNCLNWAVNEPFFYIVTGLHINITHNKPYMYFAVLYDAVKFIIKPVLLTLNKIFLIYIFIHYTGLLPKHGSIIFFFNNKAIFDAILTGLIENLYAENNLLNFCQYFISPSQYYSIFLCI